MNMRKLKPKFEGLKRDFVIAYAWKGCDCEGKNICEYCRHPGNPDNLAKNKEAWDIDHAAEIREQAKQHL